MEARDRRVKELKVNIPTELHLQLLRMKILHGQTIASTVEEALRIYFARIPPDGDERGGNEDLQPANEALVDEVMPLHRDVPGEP